MPAWSVSIHTVCSPPRHSHSRIARRVGSERLLNRVSGVARMCIHNQLAMELTHNQLAINLSSPKNSMSSSDAAGAASRRRANDYGVVAGGGLEAAIARLWRPP